ncbi:unnamed protein product, partial [Rotaria sp. Silwood2]
PDPLRDDGGEAA